MYTIISYRENDAVYRGGYCEGRTDSDMTLQSTQDREQAIELLAHAIYLDTVAQDRTLNKDYEFTAGADITLGINGYFGSSYAIDEISDEEYEKYSAERQLMLEDAEILAKRKYDARLVDHREAQRLRAEKAEQQAAERREAEERAQLARLKAKYGE